MVDSLILANRGRVVQVEFEEDEAPRRGQLVKRNDAGGRCNQILDEDPTGDEWEL